MGPFEYETLTPSGWHHRRLRYYPIPPSAFLVQNLLFEDGRARWRLNLAAIEQAMPRLGEFPALPPAAAYDGPALFIAGGQSDYLCPGHESAIRRLFPRAEIARIDNAGHWLHAEQPGSFLAIVEPFLRR